MVRQFLAPHDLANIMRWNTPAPRFAPGTQFLSRAKHPNICTVTDVLRTYNLAGEEVKTRYVATHETMGQVLTDNDVTETRIAMGHIG